MADVGDWLYSTSVNIYDIEEVLNKLNVSKGSGPDGLPLVFIRNCIFAILFFLYIIFNHS